MESLTNDMTKVFSKLKKYRGEETKRCEIPFVESLAGKFYAVNSRIRTMIMVSMKCLFRIK